MQWRRQADLSLSTHLFTAPTFFDPYEEIVLYELWSARYPITTTRLKFSFDYKIVIFRRSEQKIAAFDACIDNQFVTAGRNGDNALGIKAKSDDLPIDRGQPIGFIEAAFATTTIGRARNFYCCVLGSSVKMIAGSAARQQRYGQTTHKKTVQLEAPSQQRRYQRKRVTHQYAREYRSYLPRQRR